MLLLTSVLPIPAPRPRGAMTEKVGDRHGEIVVRVHEADAPSHDAVPVVVGIARPRDVEAILEPDEAPHRVGRRAVHADLAVPVDRHEREGRIDHVAYHRHR
jgi:hypothetical protein